MFDIPTDLLMESQPETEKSTVLIFSLMGEFTVFLDEKFILLE